MIDLQGTADGIILPVRAQAKASRNAVVGMHDRCLKVAVTAPPERGQANEALESVLAQALGLARRQVRLISGKSSNRKRFMICELGEEDLRRRLEAALRR